MDYAVALIALTVMEIVLGIDNIIFIAILTDRLPKDQQSKARKIGLGLALVMRIILLTMLSAIMAMTAPVFAWTDLGVPASLFDYGDSPEAVAHALECINVSWRDLILLFGGLFLIGKTVHEIHGQMAPRHDKHGAAKQVTFGSVLFQIALLDIVFSLDSVITAVGMAESLAVMITAVVLAVGVMIIFANSVSNFVSKHPSLKMLALSFLMLIGVMLVAEGAGSHVNKGYIYFAMAFSLIVEVLNMRVRTKVVAVSPE
jgi:predicted tellurium resistance membrane protein TerC